jgi:hypothetical protein
MRRGFHQGKELLMPVNESRADRLIRALAGAGAVGGGIAVGASSAGGIVLLVAAAVLLLTAATGFCPLYRVLRIGTDRRSPRTSG